MDGLLKETVDQISSTADPKDRYTILLKALARLPKTPDSLQAYRTGLELIKNIDDPDLVRGGLQEFAKEVPATDEYKSLYVEAIKSLLEATDGIRDPQSKKSSFLRVAGDIPKSPETEELLKEAQRRAISAANLIEDTFTRRLSLTRIAERLPDEDHFTELRFHAMSLALGLSNDPECRENSLSDIASELPKTCDYEFYRKNTFLGIANRLPRYGPFLPLYLKAIGEALKAASLLKEPYYSKYVLLFIAKELPKSPEFVHIYKEALTLAYEASTEIKDIFIKQYALMEILQELPKRPDFYPLLLKVIETMLPLFSLKSKMEDVRAIDVLDFIIVAEERKMNESKKKRYTRENYAKKFSRELDRFGRQLTDIRFIGVLKPYTHVWVRPRALRDSVRVVVKHLEELKQKFHGKEIERPVFVSESHGVHVRDEAGAAEDRRADAKDTIVIDLGATNTVIMRKKSNRPPYSIGLDSISRQFGDTFSIPTVLAPETGAIGMEASKHKPALNLKRMLLDGKPDGSKYIERYLSRLYDHLKEEELPVGWLGRFSAELPDKFYVTVPIGFNDYRKEMGSILKRTFKGLKAELIDEPLAAAIGYQVAEDRDKVVMIVDFGGSTLDVMVLRLNTREVHVIAKPDRSTILGGRDIDEWLAEYLAEKLNISTEKIPLELLAKAEELKIALSWQNVVPFEWEGAVVCNISRTDLEEILDERDFYKTVDRTISYILRKAKKIGMKKEKVESVLLTGGSSQIPSFKEKIAHTFPELSEGNAIFDHSPLSAVARGAALYGTRDVVDRHLAVAYAVRHKAKEKLYSYEIVLEKGESLPFEKTFKVTASRTLGVQDEIFIELFEVPDSLITRRWDTESGMEFIRQALKPVTDVELKEVKVVSLPFKEPVSDEIPITFCVDFSGNLTIRYGPGKTELQTGVRLQ